MRLPWFMHVHSGINTLTGILPTPCGTFVRSCANGRMEAVWYPMDGSFPGGAGRESKRIAMVDADADGERQLEGAVLAFMHEHPQLSMSCQFDMPGGEAVGWEIVGSGSLSTHQTDAGLFMRIHHAGIVTLEFIPINEKANRETVGRFADACGEETLARRIDACVGRRLADVHRDLEGKAA